MRKGGYGTATATTIAALLPSRLDVKTFMLFSNVVTITLVATIWLLKDYQPLHLHHDPCPNAEPVRNRKLFVPSPPNVHTLRPYGSAAALFVHMSSYRGGPTSFAVIGLASKPIHVFGKPWFKCEYVSNDDYGTTTVGKAEKFLPDWGYGRVYTAVVVNCTFKSNPNPSNAGGVLLLHAYYSPSPTTHETVIALEEDAGAYSESRFQSPPKYDYLYCGSPLYGNISADRIREWMAYQAWFFGPKSHFVIHDAGGVSEKVRKALEPWERIGRVTLQDVRAEEEYDGWYHNQFVVLNDCLHRYRFDAKWTFFFDVDEYLYLPDGSTLEEVMRGFGNYTQFTIEQNQMSSKLCADDERRNHSREWGFEKLQFRDDVTGIWRDRKYAIQPRNAYTTGVHMSENVVGKTLHDTETRIRYYHYHNSITVEGEPCRKLVANPGKGNVTWFEKIPYAYDDNLTRIAGTVKRFEYETIGSLLL